MDSYVCCHESQEQSHETAPIKMDSYVGCGGQSHVTAPIKMDSYVSCHESQEQSHVTAPIKMDSYVSCHESQEQSHETAPIKMDSYVGCVGKVTWQHLLRWTAMWVVGAKSRDSTYQDGQLCGL